MQSNRKRRCSTPNNSSDEDEPVVRIFKRFKAEDENNPSSSGFQSTHGQLASTSSAAGFLGFPGNLNVAGQSTTEPVQEGQAAEIAAGQGNETAQMGTGQEVENPLLGFTSHDANYYLNRNKYLFELYVYRMKRTHRDVYRPD